MSLDVPPGGEVEVDTFGLLPDHIDQGLGSHFLTVGVRLALGCGSCGVASLASLLG